MKGWFNMNPVTFLKKLIVASLKRMMKGVEKEIRAEGKASAALVATTIFIMKEMKMNRGLRLFELMICGLFAEKGKGVPEKIIEQFSSTIPVSVHATPPASKPEVAATKTKVIAVAKPTAPPAPPAKPVPATAPARELKQNKSPLEQFIDFLAAFVAEKRRLNVAKTCEAAADLLTSERKMTLGQANTLFSAIRKADLLGLHILDRRTDLAFLENVPVEVLSDHMFGLEGALNPLIEKVRSATEKDKWIIPLAIFNVRVLMALDKKSKMGEVEMSRTEALLIALQRSEETSEIKFPERVFEGLRAMVGPVDPHWTGSDMMAKKLAGLSNQIQ